MKYQGQAIQQEISILLGRLTVILPRLFLIQCLTAML